MVHRLYGTLPDIIVHKILPLKIEIPPGIKAVLDQPIQVFFPNIYFFLPFKCFTFLELLGS